MTRYSLDEPEMMEYVSNPLWELKEITKEIKETNSRFLNYTYGFDFDFSFTIQRKSLYYMANHVYPFLILNAVTLITYFLPYNLQATLCKLFIVLVIKYLALSF